MIRNNETKRNTSSDPSIERLPESGLKHDYISGQNFSTTAFDCRFYRRKGIRIRFERLDFDQ